MNGRQLVAVLMCGLLIVPVHGVALADGTGIEQSHAATAASSAQSQGDFAGFVDHASVGEADETRPDRPNITVDAVRRDVLREDTYEVEFTAVNPNERNLTIAGAFTSGTTASAAPQVLEPGENTFRVTWTPESEDERLVFEGKLERYGYDEPITAETDPASEYASDTSEADENESDAESGVELRGAQAARFDGCKYVEVDGEFGENHSIIPTITWYSELGDSPQAYGEYGLLGENFEETPFNGTIIFEIVTPEEVSDNESEKGTIIEESDDEIRYTIVEGNNTHGLGILGILSGTEYTDTYGNYTFDNPNDCFEATQPDRPTASLETIAPTGNGTYNVTVSVENPNDANMTLRGGFIGSTPATDVANDDPYLLEVGENAYTATWAPNGSGERLWFTGDLSGYDYDDPLVVETDPASEYGDVETASDEGEPAPHVIAVDADRTERTAPLNLTVEVVNEGDGRMESVLGLVRPNTSRVVEEQPLVLGPGERGSVEFTIGTETVNFDQPELYQVRAGYYSADSAHPSVETFDLRRWVYEGSGEVHPSAIVQPESNESDETANADDA